MTTTLSPEKLHAPQVTDQPLVVVEAHKSWVRINLKDLWAYRELLYFLMWRDVKVRYKQTALGAAWAILQPLLLMLIFNFFFARLAGISSGNVPYPLFAYAGLLPWTFFANAVTGSGNSLVGSTNLITKVYFPRMFIPAAAVGAGLVDLAIAFVLLIGLMVYYGVGLHLSLALLPVVIILTTLLALGVGMLMSALNVRYRDVRYALPFMIQVWMFASPVIYPLPEKWHTLFSLNPMVGIIEGFRAALFGQPPDWSALGSSAAITLAILICSVFAFSWMEKGFADVI
ncbi:MAG: lipopolysaccharide transport system permease protein [Acidobacteriota bacterium]|jgi:lipopolysaccharide transport system permease protein|nr:lipopolysaccharide transport system permease protein [Acidobacteriota bacterium]